MGEGEAAAAAANNTFSYINFVLWDADKNMLDKSVTSFELVVLATQDEEHTNSHTHTPN